MASKLWSDHSEESEESESEANKINGILPEAVRDLVDDGVVLKRKCQGSSSALLLD